MRVAKGVYTTKPSTAEGWRVPRRLPGQATSHLRGDHLAAERQVGESASPRRDVPISVTEERGGSSEFAGCLTRATRMRETGYGLHATTAPHSNVLTMRRFSALLRELLRGSLNRHPGTAQCLTQVIENIGERAGTRTQDLLIKSRCGRFSLGYDGPLSSTLTH